MNRLLSEGADLDFSDEVGLTALHYAVLGDSDEAIEVLVKEGCDINAESTYFGTALHLAVANCKTAIVRQLLAHKGTNINVRGRLVGTVLHCAALAGSTQLWQPTDRLEAQIDVIRLLLQANSSLLTVHCMAVPRVIGALIGAHWQWKELRYATKKTQPVEWAYECLPLHLAVLRGNVSIVELLHPARLGLHGRAEMECERWTMRDLKHTEIFDQSTYSSDISLLMLAASTQKPQVLKIFLPQSARSRPHDEDRTISALVSDPVESSASNCISRCDSQGCNALHHAVTINDYTYHHRLSPDRPNSAEERACIRMLHDVNMQSQADFDSENSSRRNHLLDTKDSKGRTPLHMAATLACAEELFDCGADINSRDQNGMTPAMYAAKSQKQEICDFLLLRAEDRDKRQHKAQGLVWAPSNALQSHRLECEKAAKSVKPTMSPHIPEIVVEGQHDFDSISDIGPNFGVPASAPIIKSHMKTGSMSSLRSMFSSKSRTPSPSSGRWFRDMFKAQKRT